MFTQDPENSGSFMQEYFTLRAESSHTSPDKKQIYADFLTSSDEYIINTQ